MLAFSHLISLFEAEDDLASRVDLTTALRYIHLASTLKPDILHAQVPSFDPDSVPYDLPSPIASYISSRLGLQSDEDAQGLWRVFGMAIWKQGMSVLESDSGFRVQDAADAQLAPCMIYPPIHTCDAVHCPKQQLLRRKDPARKITLFTLDKGVCDGLAANLYCHGCKTNYYPNYLVRAGSGIRTYYAGIPDAIQVAEHTYVERRVLDLFNALTLFAWTSATNAAHIYHHSLSGLHDTRRHIAMYQLRTEHVWDGYVLLALLKDAATRKYVLEVPHTGEQKDRFLPAMRRRNEYIRKFGQSEFMHFCSKCVRRFDHDDGTTSFVDAIVTDGLEMGRPCCSVRHCTEELLTTQDRYCPSHRHLGKRCVIDGCSSQSETGFKTCAHPVHRQVETWNQLHGKAMFTLRRALLRSNVSNPVDAVNPSRGPDEHLEVTVTVDQASHGELQCLDVEVDARPLGDDTEAERRPQIISENHAEDAHTVPTVPLSQALDVPKATIPAMPCPDKPAVTTRSMRAMFGRRRTHNEQLLIRPCGIIVKRATFYGSETTPQVLSLYRETYPFRDYAPSYLIYDNGCGLYKHSKASGDTLHEEIGLPVDVFHWKCKHKKSDEACSIHCNPYNYPDLRVDDQGNWFFNTSIAEQNNVWFGGYHAIIREMVAVKYDFFLDQVIMDKNKLTIEKLRMKGCIPGIRPSKN